MRAWNEYQHYFFVEMNVGMQSSSTVPVIHPEKGKEAEESLDTSGTGAQEPDNVLHDDINLNDHPEVSTAISELEDDDVPTEEIDSMSLEESIRFWALKTNQTHQSINMILDIIRKKTDGKHLPRSARSLLKTSRNASTKIISIGGGHYWYQGIKKCLGDLFR